MPTSLVCHHLTFSWSSGALVFDQLDCAFPDGKTGLIGRNGIGKSTLLRIIAGEYQPTAGYVSGPDTIGYLPQTLVLDEDRTLADLLGIAPTLAALERIDAGLGEPADFETVGDRWDVEERAFAALARLGFPEVDLGRTVDTLSGGEAMLLALAGLFLAEPDVLLLDEPTNNLDRSARERFAAAIAGWRGPVVVVSHDRELLDQMDQIGELHGWRKGVPSTCTFYGGDYTAYTEALAVEQEAAARTVRAAESDLKRQQRELAEMRIKLDRRQRFAKSQQGNIPKMAANQLKGQAELSSAKLRGGHQADVDKAASALEEAERAVRTSAMINIDLSATTVPASRDVLIMEEVLLRNGLEVSLHLRGPDRIALSGPNGSGKTTMIDTITGKLELRSGKLDLRVPHRLLPQRLQVLDDDQTVLAEVARLAPSADDNTLRAQLARFLLDAETIARPVGTLSGGERFRASLAGLLLSEPPPQLLILDEPTNNLDLDSVAQLTSALNHYRGALLIVSHDHAFLDDLGLTGELTIADGQLESTPWA